jgi:4-hydroxy-4-methyl-2-oxoglutarate aldolase
MTRRGLDPGITTTGNIERVGRDTIVAATAFPTATLHEAAGKIGALPHAIKPVAKSFRLSGPALTVHSPGGDNLWLHRALYVAQPGDVLVTSVSGAYDYGYWGEIMSTAAKNRGIAGLVIDGCVRDGVLLETIGFPVFARGLCIQGTGKDFGARGWINAPTLFDQVTVMPGDLIVGDADGVVCIPRLRADEVVRASRAREASDARAIERLNAGETTLGIFGWE